MLVQFICKVSRNFSIFWECVYTPGGGTQIFSVYVGSDPASTVHPKKYQEFQAPLKYIWNFSNPKKYPTLKKDPKMHRNDTQTSPILWWPQKNIHKIFIPPKDIYFSQNRKKYWNSEYWTQKNGPSLRMCENIRVPAPPPPPGVYTPDRRQSKTLLSIDERGSKIAINSVSDCHLSPVGRQMAIENFVSNYFDIWSSISFAAYPVAVVYSEKVF